MARRQNNTSNNGVKWAERKLSPMTEGQVMCRFRRHWWDLQGWARWEGYIVSVHRCDSCTTVKRDYWTTDKVNGGIEKSFTKYSYPKGYRIAYTDAERQAKLRLKPRHVASVLVHQYEVGNDLEALLR